MRRPDAARQKRQGEHDSQSKINDAGAQFARAPSLFVLYRQS
tara:strand:+ start:7934 stop:8059 length:126 start_codon:yes stop_codon:yes gene_type:complete